MRTSLLQVLALVAAMCARRGAHGVAPFPSSTGSLLEGQEGVSMKIDYPFYHTSDEVRLEVARLAQGCNGSASFRTERQGDASIDVVSVRAKGARPVNRVFLLFGEHSRELISPETGLYFLRVLCGDAELADSAGGTSPAAVLQDSEFEIVLNANPRSRRTVESGDYCLRTNPNGVDLNRNWDVNWHGDPSFRGLDTNPGPHPFSEPETQILRRILESYDPTAFLCVHSGTRGMYMPFAYDSVHLAQRNRDAMLQLLRLVDAAHCKCPYGAAGKEVGYDCPGTSLDWVYEHLNVTYSFAWEIFTGFESDSALQQRWEEKLKTGAEALLQRGENLGHPHFVDLFEEHPSDFVLRTPGGRSDKAGAAFLEREPSEETAAECFKRFNPMTQSDYTATVSNWASAYLEMAARLAAHLHFEQASSTGAATAY